MREYWKTSLFLYEVDDDASGTPIITFWRATAYTFGAPAKKRTLKNAIRELTEGELIQPNELNKTWVDLGFIEPSHKRVSWEKRQVPASDSKGLGFNWIEISRGEKRGLRVKPEERVAVWNLPAYEKNDLRLGYAEFLSKAAAYGKDKRARLSLGRVVKSFWEWLTS